MVDTLRLIERLFPEVTTVWAIVDSTPSGQGDLATFYAARSIVPDLDLRELSLVDRTFEELETELRDLDTESAVLLRSAYNDAAGTRLLFRESLARITDSLDRPLFHLWYHGMGDGVFGGILISHSEQTATAARLLKRIIVNETPASAIPIVTRSPNIPVFAWRQLDRFGIPLSALPPDSEVLNRPQSLYREYRTEV